MRPFLLAAISILTLAGAAHAQTSSDKIDEVRKDARLHVGPFYVTPALQLKELGIDTNVFNETVDPRSDFTFTLGPKADVWVPVARRALVSLVGGTDLVWFAKYKSERSVDPHVSVRGDLFFNRLTLFAGQSHINSRQRVNPEIDIRARHLRNATTAGLDYRLTPKFSVELSGERSTTDYAQDAVVQGESLRNNLNRTSLTGGVTARHRLTPLTTLTLRAEHIADDFAFSSIRNSRSIRVLPGVEFKPRALIRGAARLGMRRFSPTQGDILEGYTGLVADLGLSYTLLGRTTFGASVGRDVEYSFQELRPYYVNTSVGGSVRHALGPRFDVLVSADRHRNAYREGRAGESTLGSSTLSPLVETTWHYAGSLGFRINRLTRIGAGVSYWKRDSTGGLLREYEGLRIRTTVTYGL